VLDLRVRPCHAPGRSVLGLWAARARHSSARRA
jgi:hypothetical protein